MVDVGSARRVQCLPNLFRDEGGEVLFLGTVNPAAARVYNRLGWRRLAGSTVYANVTADLSPEEFLVDWFRGVAGPVTVTRMLCLGTIEERIQQVLMEKRQLFDAILSRTSVPESSGLSQQDIFGLFDLKLPSREGETGPILVPASEKNP